jgi:hypothetical protein
MIRKDRGKKEGKKGCKNEKNVFKTFGSCA